MHENCCLRGLKSKRTLNSLICISNRSLLCRKDILKRIHPKLIGDNKKRIIEPAEFEVKQVQSRIKRCIEKCDIPDNIFSGVKKKSYVDNAKAHEDGKFIYKVDITAFFPNIHRDKVYRFFSDDLIMSPDAARILTDYLTVDITQTDTYGDEIKKFLDKKRITCRNHLITGSPASPILSYLVNRIMFQEIINYFETKGMSITIYVDDITVSSKVPIPKLDREWLIDRLIHEGYSVQRKKVVYYRLNDIKKVTGVIIKPDGSLEVPNRLRKKIHELSAQGDVNTEKLLGCIYAAKQIRHNIYPNLIKHVYRIKGE